MERFFKLIFYFGICAFFFGCASSDPLRAPATFGGSDESNAHPASYITERFPINRPLPAHKPSNNAPFYFKKCNMAGDNWPISTTRYDCEYP